MPCSTCKTAPLRAFIAAIASIDARTVPRASHSSISSSPRRAVHTSLPMRIRPSMTKQDVSPSAKHHPSSSLDGTYIPFDFTTLSQGHSHPFPGSSSQAWQSRSNADAISQRVAERLTGHPEYDPEPELTLLDPGDVDSKRTMDSVSVDKIKTTFIPTSSFCVPPNTYTTKSGQQASRLSEHDQLPQATRVAKEKNKANHEREPWQIQKQALTEKFGSTGWAPRKRLSPDALEGIRALHAQYPEKYTTPELAHQFGVSPEAIRRILKGRWKPSEEEEIQRRRRWDKRGEAIWSKMVEIGIKPPRKWRQMGVGKDHVHRHERRDRSASRQESAKKQDLENVSARNWPISKAVASSGRPSGSCAPLSERIL